MRPTLKAMLATIACASFLPLGAAFASPTFSLSGPASVTPGTMFNLNVLATGVSDLFAYQFGLAFDQNRFRVAGVSEGLFLSGAGTTFFDPGTIENTLGEVSYVIDTLIGSVAGASGSGVLASFSVEAIGVSNTSGAFSLNNVLALDSNGGVIDVGLGAAAVDIPTPGTLVLVLGGLAAAALRSRRSPQSRSKPMP